MILAPYLPSPRLATQLPPSRPPARVGWHLSHSISHHERRRGLTMHAAAAKTEYGYCNELSQLSTYLLPSLRSLPPETENICQTSERAPFPVFRWVVVTVELTPTLEG